MHIAMLAGEASGDQLGAELIKALRKINPSIRFNGVGGPLMQEQGFESLLPIEDFAVMGITEIVKSLPRLLRYRSKLIEHYKNLLPDAFIGIDYPEFNLNLERHFKSQGIYTAQYVSPSVWAWRQERLNQIKKSTDLMLTLFNFEKQFYDEHKMPAIYCGHPLVDMIPENASTFKARESLGLSADVRNYLAVLPGSRLSEVKKMMPIYIDVMHELLKYLPDLTFLIPAANAQLKECIEQCLKNKANKFSYQVFLRQSRMVMQASDAVLLTSGTVTLEAMLLEKPMLVSYKTSYLTAKIAKKKLSITHFSLPNLLADHPIVPEFIQEDINPKEMAKKLYLAITPTTYRKTMVNRLKGLRKKMKIHAADNAAEALYQDMLYHEMLPN